MAKSAYIACDIQEDYLPGGPLGYEGSDKILECLGVNCYRADIFIATRNQHPPDHISFEEGRMPVNCLKGSKGSRLIHGYLPDYVITKGLERVDYGFSAFDGGTLRPIRSLEEIMKDEGIRRVQVGGYWLGQCVSFTAFDSAALGFSTAVLLDDSAVRPGTDVTKEIERLERAGIILL